MINEIYLENSLFPNKAIGIVIKTAEIIET